MLNTRLPDGSVLSVASDVEWIDRVLDTLLRQFALALGGWLVARRRGIRFPALLDACAPGLAVAQGIGRLGNWFNSELFGRPTTLPWGLEIAPGFRPAGYEQYATFHPTFLYELLWNLALAAVVIWADWRFTLSHGRAFALYVAGYCLGRGWIEVLRIDTAETFFGVRLNVFTSVVVGLLAVAYLVWQRGRPREEITRGRELRRREAALDDGTVDGPGGGQSEQGAGRDAGRGPGTSSGTASGTRSTDATGGSSDPA